jgi:hypothetical protein
MFGSKKNTIFKNTGCVRCVPLELEVPDRLCIYLNTNSKWQKSLKGEMERRRQTAPAAGALSSSEEYLITTNQRRRSSCMEGTQLRYCVYVMNMHSQSSLIVRASIRLKQ